MKKNNKGFVVSAVLYPLLVLFLALIMGLLSMSDTRKRILDRMKLEISDSIFDEATCSCDTILNKLNYLIKNGVSGGTSSGGSYTYNVLGLNVKKYGIPTDMPNTANAIGDIAIVTSSIVEDESYKDFTYYVSKEPPKDPKEGQVWIAQDISSEYQIKSDYSSIGINYAMEYYNGEWTLRKTYVYTEEGWTLLYYVPVSNGEVDLSSSDINGKVKWEYDYTGEYQTFTAPYSGYYKIELWGAQGGTADSYGKGGTGAYTKGEIYLNAGDNLYVYVGAQGSKISGGWNGGGDGYNSSYAGLGGGGATDIRLVPTSEKTKWEEFDSLKSRIMVAAGGGGGGTRDASDYTIHGGSGGGLSGLTGSSYNGQLGTGGTQSLFGHNKVSMTSNAGGFGYGGTASGTASGGGGGGWYGGGSSGYWGGGGGGSSYISGYEGCNSIEEISKTTNIIHNGRIFHYSNHYFINTEMKEATNSGNGKAIITLLSIEMIDNSEFVNYILSSENVWNYTYSGKYQIFKTHKEGRYSFQLWGAQGGTVNSYGVGGKGGYTYGETTLKEGTILYIYVGQQPNSTSAGWNGGGAGYDSSYDGYGGGGATDIRISATTSAGLWNERNSLKTRIMVAAGGGGGGTRDASNYTIHGGSGGGLSGLTGSSYNGNLGTGGTQTLPGNNKVTVTSNVGGFGYGAAASGAASGGGGSGWYGGGSSGYWGSGGGGSSYISGHAGCIAVTSEGLAKVQTYSKISDSISYTEYKFINTQIIDGNGYVWTTSKSTTSSGMPSPTTSSIIVGNTGNGYAKITYLGE